MKRIRIIYLVLSLLLVSGFAWATFSGSRLLNYLSSNTWHEAPGTNHSHK